MYIEYLHTEAIFRLGLVLKSCHGWKDHMIEPLRMVRRLTTRERKPGEEPGIGYPWKSTAKASGFRRCWSCVLKEKKDIDFGQHDSQLGFASKKQNICIGK
jgi:hypothetical protein